MHERKERILAGDKAYKFRDAFLAAFFGLFGDLSITRNGLLHYSSDVSDRQKSVLLNSIEKKQRNIKRNDRKHLQKSSDLKIVWKKIQ